MIRKLLTVLLSLIVATALTACIDLEMVVKVKPDGSGTVEEKVLMKKALVEMMKNMGNSLAAIEEKEPGAEPEPEFSLLDREELEEDAKAMGAGVTLVSAEPLSTDSGEGYLARFAFEDINKLRLNQNPGDRAPAEGDPADGPEAGKKKEPLSFQFTPGDEPVLVIRAPAGDTSDAAGAGEGTDEADTDAADAEEGEEGVAEAMAMMQQMLDGLRVAIHIEVEGEILETNATHREGSRVILMEMDFSKLLQDPERFQAFVKSDPEGMQDAKALMKDLPGAKVDLNEEIEIRFAPK